MRIGSRITVSVLATAIMVAGAEAGASIGPKVWFVDNTAAGSGDGSLGSPFTNLAEAERRSGPGEWIFIRSGDGSSRGLDAGIRLKPGQALLGEGVGLVTDSDSIVPGPAPTLSNPSGHGVVLASGCEVGGLRIGSVRGAGLIGVDVRDIRLRDLSVADTGGDGVELENPGGLVELLGLEITGVAGDGLSTRLDGSIKTVMTVEGCRFSRINKTAASVTIQNRSALRFEMANSRIVGAGMGIELTVLGSARLAFRISDNPELSGIEGTIVNLFVDPKSTVEALASGEIARNPLMSKEPGSGFGIRLSGNGAGKIAAVVSDNRITGGVENDYGILAEARLGTAVLDLELAANEVVVGAEALEAIAIRARDDARVCFRAVDNRATGGTVGLSVRQRGNAVFALSDQQESRIEPAAAEQRLASANPGLSGVAASADTGFSGAFEGCSVSKEIVQ